MAKRATNVGAARTYGGLSLVERRAERRARLLEAGFALFGTAGYPVVSIPEICSKAAVTARHFYEEFASREALIKQIYDDLTAVLLERVARALSGTETNADRVVRAGCAAYADYLTSDPRRARLVAIEVAGISQHLDHHRMKVRRRFASLILDSSRRLREAAVAEPDLDLRVVSTLLTGAADALMTEWALTREPPVATMIDTMTTVWMRSLQLDRTRKRRAAYGAAPVLSPAEAAAHTPVPWPSLGLGRPLEGTRRAEAASHAKRKKTSLRGPAPTERN